MTANLPEGIALSLAALRRELPRLLGGSDGEWVATGRAGVLRVGRSQEELYAWCLRVAKLPEGEFVVRFISPDMFDDYADPAADPRSLPAAG